MELVTTSKWVSYKDFLRKCYLIEESQFRLLVDKVLQKPELSDEPKFASNAARVANRTELVQIISDVLKQHSREYWLERFKGLG